MQNDFFFVFSFYVKHGVFKNKNEIIQRGIFFMLFFVKLNHNVNSKQMFKFFYGDLFFICSNTCKENKIMHHTHTFSFTN